MKQYTWNHLFVLRIRMESLSSLHPQLFCSFTCPLALDKSWVIHLSWVICLESLIFLVHFTRWFRMAFLNSLAPAVCLYHMSVLHQSLTLIHSYSTTHSHCTTWHWFVLHHSLASQNMTLICFAPIIRCEPVLLQDSLAPHHSLAFLEWLALHHTPINCNHSVCTTYPLALLTFFATHSRLRHLSSDSLEPLLDFHDSLERIIHTLCTTHLRTSFTCPAPHACSAPITLFTPLVLLHH